VLAGDGLAAELAASGLETVRARHTCGHRVNELLEIVGAAGDGLRVHAAGTNACATKGD